MTSREYNEKQHVPASDIPGALHDAKLEIIKLREINAELLDACRAAAKWSHQMNDETHMLLYHAILKATS